jgi:hypothetical protein
MANLRVGYAEIEQFPITAGKQRYRPLMMFDVSISSDYGREAHSSPGQESSTDRTRILGNGVSEIPSEMPGGARIHGARILGLFYRQAKTAVLNLTTSRAPGISETLLSVLGTS